MSIEAQICQYRACPSQTPCLNHHTTAGEVSSVACSDLLTELVQCTDLTKTTTAEATIVHIALLRMSLVWPAALSLLVHVPFLNISEWYGLAQFMSSCKRRPPSLLPSGYKLEGVLLTHLHMGHYFGLAQFGKEALNMKGLKVGVSRFVRSPFRAKSNLRWWMQSAAVDCNIYSSKDPLKRLLPYTCL